MSGVQGEQQAHARFESAEAAKAFLDSKPDSKLAVGDSMASLSLLEGDDETAYIAKVQALSNVCVLESARLWEAVRCF